MRVAENLNTALHTLMADNTRLHLLGEDIADPYGGAFSISRGLSTRFPERVHTTPLSEGGIVGAGAGLALAGDAAIVEIMFADFVTLAFDQIVNFAGKSVSMYGSRVPVPLVVRCPTGGGRGYGPTHSQSLQKHFIGVPGLSVHEISPFHDAAGILRTALERGEPSVLFEDKILYTQQMADGGEVDALLSYDVTPDGLARVFVGEPDDFECVLIAPGGVAHRAMDAMRSLLVEEEVTCLLVVPTRLYPFDVEPLVPLVRNAAVVCVAEESTAGGTWGAELSHLLHRRLWGELRRPVALAHSADSIVPTAAHLEEQVLLRDTTIHRTVMRALSE